MRIIVSDQVYVYAAGRRDELWEGVAQDTAAINRIASNEKMKDINKVSSAVDLAAELRLKLRELGVW